MNPTNDPSLALRLRIDAACDRFEAEWQSGGRPDPVSFASDTPAEDHGSLLLALIAIDAEYRRKAGETPTSAEYRARFPDLDPAALDRAVGDPDRTGAADEDNTPPDFGSAGALSAEPVPVPGYEILGEIARGGMGVVYSARDTVLNREVAVKTVLAPSPAVRARFVREAHITGQLEHPAIPPVHTLGLLPDGRPFLAMKLIRGQTLAAALAARSDPSDDLPRFVPVFEQICQAVGFAHANGIVHRDLKPANVMVGAFGEVQVMDWGLAKDARGTDPDLGRGEAATRSPLSEAGDLPTPDDHTHAGAILGTPAYMAPEQARGEGVDARADVFALGGILCAILTGQPPNRRTNAIEVIARAAAGDLTAAFARLDGCGADPELVALAKRCLSPERDDRPESGGEVATAVAELRTAADERARQAELDRVRAVGERAKAELQVAEQRKRRKVQLALAVAVLLLAGGGGAVAWWQDRLAGERKAEALRRQIEDERIASQERERETRNRDAFVVSLERCENALREGESHTAGLALPEVENRLEGGTEQFAGRVERCRAELGMLRQLDTIDLARSTLTAGKLPDGETITPALVKAFADYGITPGLTSASEAAGRINAALIRESLLTSLEVWFVHAHHDPRLRAILSAADPDEFRDEARATNYQRALLARAFRGKPLPGAQPVWFAVGHGEDRRRVDRGLREQLLMVAHRSRPNSFQLLMTLGVLHDPGDRESAVRSVGWYQAVLALQPRNGLVWNNLGAALTDSGDIPSAIASYREAIRVDPKYAPAHYNLGLTLKRTGDVPGAIVSYREAIRRDPEFIHAHNALGSALRAAGDVPGAIAAFREAVRTDPTNAPAHTGLGGVLADANDLPGAIASHKEAVRLNPNYALAHFNLGVTLSNSGDHPGAIISYREAIRLDPMDAVAHIGLGNVLRDAGDRPGAIAAYREAIRVDPKYARAHTSLGNILRASGDLPGAVAAFREAINLDPKKATRRTDLGDALRDSGDLPGAIASYREAIRLDPTLAAVHHNLGLFLHDAQDLAGAVAAYKEAIRLDPMLPQAHYNLGNARLATGDLPGGIASYKEAIRLDPKYAQAHNNLGNALRQSGDLPGAIAASKEAIRLNPKLAPAHTNLGTAYFTQKKYPEAIACARDAIKINPKSPGAHALLGYALLQSGDIPGARVALTEASRLDKQWAQLLAQLPERDPPLRPEVPNLDGPGLRADVFQGKNFQRLVHVRRDERLSWKGNPARADPYVMSQQFSIRWTGWLHAPVRGKYRLEFHADDGVRLWIGGKPVIDAWKAPQVETHRVDVELTGGPQEIRIEYFQDQGGAAYEFRWIPPGTSESVVIPPAVLRPTRTLNVAPPPREVKP